MGAGLGFAGTISALLIVLIKLLFVLFIVGLVGTIALALKKYIYTNEDIEKVKGTFSGKKNVVSKETCGTCGKTVETEWKACPYCGELKAGKVTAEA